MSRTVVVGVCTFRRPSLRETLLSLASQRVPGGLVLRIAVADNDEGPSARDLVSGASAEVARSIAYLHCPARNISVARNALLDLAHGEGADLVAFLDDDEWVGPDWLAQMVRALDGAGADAVFGPVRGVYADDAPRWMRAGSLHDVEPELGRDGQVRTGYAGNVLMAPDAPSLLERRFDPALGRSGGEDTAFFAGAKADGAVLVTAPEAVAFEHVPPERTRIGWLVQRRFRMGQTHGQLIGRDASPARRTAMAAVACAKVVASLALAVPVAHRPERRGRALLRGCLHAGAVSSLVGMRSLALYGSDALPSPVRPTPSDHGARR